MGILEGQDIGRGRGKNLKPIIIFLIILSIGIYFLFFKNSNKKVISIDKKVEKKVKTETMVKNNRSKIVKKQQNFRYVKTIKRSIQNLESRPDLKTIEGVVGKGEPLAYSLKELKIDPNQVYNLVQSMKKAGYDFRSTKPGETFIIRTDEEGKIWEYYHFSSKLTYYYTYRNGKKLITSKVSKKIKEEEIVVVGEITSSISEAIEDAGEHINLAIQLADFVFRGGEIDFFSDCQKGDRFVIKVSKKYYENLKGKKIYTGTYGDIEAVLYKGKTVGDVYAFKYFEKKDENAFPDYYNEKGESVIRPFLKYPFTFRVAISSRFGMRKDPVTRSFSRMHKGVDFPVPVGKPFISVAKGKIVSLGYQKNGAGKWLRIRHKNGYETEFFHLSKIKKSLKIGKVVQQGEVLGRSGNTGRSTGPHLHYGMRKNGVHINPMAQKFTTKIKPLPKDQQTKFLKYIKPLKDELDKKILKIVDKN